MKRRNIILNEVEGGIEVDQSIAMANYLILLSRGTTFVTPPPAPYHRDLDHHDDDSSISSYSSRVFECKTCNRQFTSFQALGGHRASHKKPRLGMAAATGLGVDDHNIMADHQGNPSPAKPKTHGCTICGSEFAIGQALGGHMRRHRGHLYDQTQQLHVPPLSLSLATGTQVMKKKKPISSSTRPANLCLDLNLTPLENGLLDLAKVAPIFG
ncbi:hypothetical protein Dimus_011362 [Dionaea muscipula]